MKIIYSRQFRKEYDKLPTLLKEGVEKKETIFRNNPFDRRLKTHKLSGQFEGFWSFSVDYRHRIIFELKSESSVIFHIIGDHSIYKGI